MRIYKPIDGLLPEHSPPWRRPAWIAAPVAALLLLPLLFLRNLCEPAPRPSTDLLPSRVLGHASGLVAAAQRSAARDADSGGTLHALAKLPPSAAPLPPAHAAKNAAQPSQTPQAPAPPSLGLLPTATGATLVQAQPPQAPPLYGPEPPPAPPGQIHPSPLAAQDRARDQAAPTPSLAIPGKDGLVEGRVLPNQTLYDALAATRLSPAKIQPAIDALAKVIDFRRTHAGDPWAARYDAQGRITELSYQPSPEITRLATLQKDLTYKTSERKTPLDIRYETLGGTVRSSVYAALRDAGVNSATITKFIDLFANDLNFANDSKPGDTFRLAFEKLYIHDKFLRNGDLVAVEYKTPAKTVRLFLDKPSGAWFSPSGQSSKRLFLQNPVPNARLTSKFGMRRHPILKRQMMHNGVDYAAPSGTPVRAIASGKITHLGNAGASGNLVAIKHSNGMSSSYAHLQKFNPKLKLGDEVSQGQVVGYVGSTGRSTGPHLHLAIKNPAGAYIDPLSADAVRSSGLSGQDLRRFKQATKPIDLKLQQTKIQPPTGAPPEPLPDSHDED